MKIKVSFFFAWYDFWVGFYYDRNWQTLYVCPLPCCVFKFARNLTMRAADFAETSAIIEKTQKEIASAGGVPPEYWQNR